jgi:hypothetical protein
VKIKIARPNSARPDRPKTKKAGEIRPSALFKSRIELSALYVAISAVYRFIAARLERYLSLFAALCTDRGIHLARAPAHTAAAIAITLRPSILPAGWATLGLISVAFG